MFNHVPFYNDFFCMIEILAPFRDVAGLFKNLGVAWKLCPEWTYNKKSMQIRLNNQDWNDNEFVRSTKILNFCDHCIFTLRIAFNMPVFSFLSENLFELWLKLIFFISWKKNSFRANALSRVGLMSYDRLFSYLYSFLNTMKSSNFLVLLVVRNPSAFPN